MKAFNIGDTVQVSAFASVDYHEENEKTCRAYNTIPFLAVVTGKSVKQLGTYSCGRGGGLAGYDNEDYTPPTLIVGGTVTLWEVKTGWLNKVILVRDEDLVKSDFVLRLPQTGRKPQRSFTEIPDFERPIDASFKKRLLLTDQRGT